MTTKLSTTAFNTGVRRGVYSGRHKLEVKPRSIWKHSKMAFLTRTTKSVEERSPNSHLGVILR